jgi:pimeloyl-ACP methyl ester carboxylesterase
MRLRRVTPDPCVAVELWRSRGEGCAYIAKDRTFAFHGSHPAHWHSHAGRLGSCSTLTRAPNDRRFDDAVDAEVPQRSCDRHATAPLAGVAIVLVLLATITGAWTSVAAAASASSARLPGVGHDATYRPAPCPNPLVPGAPLVLGPDFRCGYLTVPENRHRPRGRLIHVAVAIAKAASVHPKADPLLWLEGGPGGTGLAVADRVVGQGINADREVVFVDQRGTLKAQPRLSCPGYDAFLIRGFALSPSGSTYARQEVASVGACRRSWVARGYDLSSFNTPENAADMADLRIALGIKHWNVYGVSYGSDLALQLLRDYPAGIRSEVLDSVVPPQANIATGFWSNAAAGYRNILGACEARSACRVAYPHLASDLVAAVQRLTRRPVTVRVLNPVTATPAKVVFDGYQFANLLIVLSLTPGTSAQIPAMVHEMASGQAAQSALRLLATAPPVGLAGDGLAFGVFCSEDAPFTTPARALAAARTALPGFPDRVLALTPQLAHMFADCRAWRVSAAGRGVRAPARSRIPVLELSGTFDAITSAAWAHLVARTLPHARIVRFPGVGHDVVNWSQCGAQIMVGFLDRPRGGYSIRCASQLPAKDPVAAHWMSALVSDPAPRAAEIARR